MQLATLHIRHVAAPGKGVTKIAEAGRLFRWWNAYLRTLGDRPPAEITSEDACDGFARWLQRRVIDSTQYLKLENHKAEKLMGHDHIMSTQVYTRPTMADQWSGLNDLKRLRSARITGDGNVVMLPIPTTLADHEEITRATMDCGSYAEKDNVARHGRACQFGNECLNCFFFRATVGAGRIGGRRAARRGIWHAPRIDNCPVNQPVGKERAPSRSNC